MEFIKNGEGELYTPTGHDASVFSRKIHKNIIDVHVTTFPQSSGMEEEVHENKAHVFYVVQGSMAVLHGGEVLDVLNANDAVVIHAGETHEIENAGEENLVFLAITFKEI